MLKFYFDEDSAQHRLIEALRSHLVDVATSLELGMNARDDETQLIFATGHARVLVTANTSDFAALHHKWQLGGKHHSGILIIPQQRFSTGEVVRRILRLNSRGIDLSNSLNYLSNY